MTPLICASKFGSVDACRLLIQNGAHITKKSCNGQSPLHYAARKGHTAVLEVGLIQTLMKNKIILSLKFYLNSEIKEFLCLTIKFLKQTHVANVNLRLT